MGRTFFAAGFVAGLGVIFAALGCQCDETPDLVGDEAGPTFEGGVTPCKKEDASDLTPCATGVIDFGNVPVGTSIQRSISIGNSGTANLEFREFTISYLGGATADAFAEGARPGVIEPNKTGEYIMAYLPRSVGADSGALRIEAYINKLTDKVEIYDFTLKGTGVQAAIDVCVIDDAEQCVSSCPKDAQGKPTDCLQVAFGEINLGSGVLESERKVKVINRGGLPVMVHSTPVLQCPITKPECQLSEMKAAREYSVIDPVGGLNEIEVPGNGAEKVLTLKYKPFDGGVDLGVLKVRSEDQLSPEINVYLGGSGKAPKICPEPVSVDFGTVYIGESKTETVKLKSCGTDPLELKAVTLTNNASNWYTTDSVAPNAPVTLNPGEETVVTVTCRPDKVVSETGQLNVETNDPGLSEGKGYIRLLCQGRETPTCKMKADPANLDFGKLAGGRTSTREFHLLNVGDLACTVNSLSGPSEAEYTITSILDDTGKPAGVAPFTIDPTRRIKVTVQFTAPQTKVCIDDKITAANTSTNAPSLDVSLHGCGGETPFCKFKVQPLGTLTFGNVAVNSKKTLGVTFDNIGTDVCEITQAKFGAQTGDWFSFAKAYTYPITIQPQSSTKVEVACSPKATGPAPNSLGIPDIYGWNVLNTTTNDPAQPQNGGASACTSPGWCHKLLCTGVHSRLDVLPNPIEFSLVTIGCNSQEIVVKLYNNGTAALNVSQLEVIPQVNPPVFVISNAPGTPFSIGANSSVQVKMKYRPGKKGIETGTLRIHTDAPNANNGVIDVPMTGEGTDQSGAKDVFKQTDKPTVDVLWCVDNSGSMGDDQQGMASNFPPFINYATSLNIDYQIGVVTSEVNEGEKGDTGDMIYPGVLFQRAGYPRILTNSVPHPATPPYQPTNVNPVDAFEANAMPGECCSGEQEACMEAVRMALSTPLIDDDQANKGLLRKYAKLVVIILSDEEDQSSGAVDYYADFLKGIKGPRNTGLLSVSVIAGFDRDGDVANPPTPQVCPGAQSTEAAGVRFLDLFKKVGNGLAMTICSPSWGVTMQKLGLDAFVAIIEYYLSRQADPSTIVVKVNGAQQQNDPVNGYTYDPNTNSIVFGSGAVPPKGATIEVSYSAQCY